MKLINKLTRMNFRLRIKSFEILFIMAFTQSLNAINSIIDSENDLHIIFWDFDNCLLSQVEETLTNVQDKFMLSNIYILKDDLENSFRAICFSVVDYKTLLKIILDTRYIDMGFFNYTVKNHHASIRYSKKIDRENQDIISVLKTYYQPIPKILNHKIYTTSLNKRSLDIIIGDKN